MKCKLFLLLASILSLSACNPNKNGVVDLTLPEEQDTTTTITAQYTYSHPCAMWNQADFDRVKTAISTGSGVVYDEFENLKRSPYASKTYTPAPQTLIVRGDPAGTGVASENYAYAMRDAAAAYQQAMLWKLTGDTDYANMAVNIMNQWAKTCQGITSNDANQMLAAGAQGYTFACAAELMLDYEGWEAGDLAQFKNWMVNVFASKNLSFMKHTDSNVCSLHYWSNWDLVNMCSYLAIGILTENDEMVNFIVNYFYSGVGNGCITNLVQAAHTDPLGTGETLCQNQESGRDQGHATMSAVVAANLCQMAYTFYLANPTITQLDFFAANDNAILKMAEYVALYNLKDGADNSVTNSAWVTGTWAISDEKMPFTEYIYCTNCVCKNTTHGSTQSVCSNASRGTVRPGWEILYNHYAKIKGMGSGYVYTQRFAERNRPEGGSGDSRYGSNSGAFDQLGWGTLMMYRE